MSLTIAQHKCSLQYPDWYTFVISLVMPGCLCTMKCLYLSKGKQNIQTPGDISNDKNLLVNISWCKLFQNILTNSVFKKRWAGYTQVFLVFLKRCSLNITDLNCPCVLTCPRAAAASFHSSPITVTSTSISPSHPLSILFYNVKASAVYTNLSQRT